MFYTAQPGMMGYPPTMGMGMQPMRPDPFAVAFMTNMGGYMNPMMMPRPYMMPMQPMGMMRPPTGPIGPNVNQPNAKTGQATASNFPNF